jgi:hypothetical protein
MKSPVIFEKPFKTFQRFKRSSPLLHPPRVAGEERGGIERSAALELLDRFEPET